MTSLQTRDSRLRLDPQRKPYKVSLDRGLTLGYRRPVAGPGSWVVIGSDGQGGQWTDTFAQADDEGPADGVAIMSYGEARRRAEELARGRGNAVLAASRPVTIDEALTNYAIDLAARGGNVGNARHVRYHLPEALLPELLSRVTSKQLAAWRLALLQGGMKPATMNRLFKSVHAAFNREAKLDKRIAANASEWKVGLEFIAGANTARKALLGDAQVRALVAAAYDLGEGFGVYIQAHAELGSRSDQIARITVADVESDAVMVPNSGKGRGKHKSRTGATAVALTAGLAKRFNELTKSRGPDELLLAPFTASQVRSMFMRVVTAAQVPEGTTPIAFRHSSIVRALRANVPIKTVADWHNTSVRMIETNYARYMRNTHHDLIRPALLNTAPGENVVALARRA